MKILFTAILVAMVPSGWLLSPVHAIAQTPQGICLSSTNALSAIASMQPATASTAGYANWDLGKFVAQIRNPSPHLVMIAEHRGAWEHCPDSSVEAFYAAALQGAENIEIDARVSADGKLVLGHDFDLRGEAPVNLTPGVQSNNFKYQLTAAAMSANQMVDRFGRPAVDNQGNKITYHGGTDLFNALVSYASAVGGIDTIQSNGFARKISRGTFITFDLKGDDGNLDPSLRTNQTTMYYALTTAVQQLYLYEVENNIDLSGAIAFKIRLNSFATATYPGYATQFQNDVTSAIANTPGFNKQLTITPYVIFILYPSDAQNAPNPVATPNANSANVIDALHSLETYSGFLMLNCNYNNIGSALAPWFYYERVLSNGGKGQGVGVFQPNNAFPEGSRDNPGTIAIGVQSLYKNSASTLDFLFRTTTNHLITDTAFSSQSSTAPPPTLLTTDVYDDADSYLSSINLRDRSVIMP